MKNHILVFTAIFAMTSFSGCGKQDDPDKEILLSDITEPGIYMNADPENNDGIEVMDNNQIKLLNTDKQDLMDRLSKIIEGENIDKEEFASSLDEPFTIDVDEGNVERTYNLRIPVFGEDAPVRIIINYDKENETMIFKSNDYVLSDRESSG